MGAMRLPIGRLLNALINRRGRVMGHRFQHGGGVASAIRSMPAWSWSPMATENSRRRFERVSNNDPAREGFCFPEIIQARVDPCA